MSARIKAENQNIFIPSEVKFINKYGGALGNLSTQRAEQDYKFNDCVYYPGKPCFKKQNSQNKTHLGIQLREFLKVLNKLELKRQLNT